MNTKPKILIFGICLILVISILNMPLTTAQEQTFKKDKPSTGEWSITTTTPGHYRHYWEEEPDTSVTIHQKTVGTTTTGTIKVYYPAVALSPYVSCTYRYTKPGSQSIPLVKDGEGHTVSSWTYTPTPFSAGVEKYRRKYYTWKEGDWVYAGEYVTSEYRCGTYSIGDERIYGGVKYVVVEVLPKYRYYWRLDVRSVSVVNYYDSKCGPSVLFPTYNKTLAHRNTVHTIQVEKTDGWVPPSTSTVYYNWFKPVIEARNQAIDKWVSVKPVLNYWDTVGFKDAPLGITTVFGVYNDLADAYSKSSDIKSQDVSYTAFKNYINTSSVPGNSGTVKQAYANISKFIGDALTNATNTIGQKWLPTAQNRIDAADESISAAGKSISSAEDNRIDLVDNNAVYSYARALFLLDMLTVGGTDVVVGISDDPVEQYEEYMGQHWSIPSEVLSKAKAVRDAAETDFAKMKSAYNNINNTYNQDWELVGENVIYNNPWAVWVQDYGGNILGTVPGAKHAADDSISTTVKYLENIPVLGGGYTSARKLWEASKGTIESRLAELRNSSDPAEQELYGAVSRLYNKAKVHATAAGWEYIPIWL